MYLGLEVALTYICIACNNLNSNCRRSYIYANHNAYGNRIFQERINCEGLNEGSIADAQKMILEFELGYLRK